MTEFPRRALHAGGAVVPLAAAFGLVPWWVVQVLVAVGTASCCVLEFFRLRGDIADWRVFEAATREYERDTVAGYALYVVGALVTVFFFPQAVAVPALLFLTIGDPVAGMLDAGDGSRKSVFVMAATAAVCAVLAWTFGTSVLSAGVAGVVVALADGLNVRVAGYFVDDNLTIPILGALALFVTGLVA